MENLLTRIRRTGSLIIGGIFLIIYIGFGIIYFQQEPRQRNLQEQIVKSRVVLAKPMPSVEKLRADYDAVNRALSPVPVPAALDAVVSAAKKSGIDVNPEEPKLIIPAPGLPRPEKVGDGSYQVLPISNIRVQSDDKSVMAFIADLDSGKTMPTLVLKRVNLSQVEVKYQGEEAARRTEFRTVSAAVKAMMTGNRLVVIPDPVNYAGGTASNQMGYVAGTPAQGFPNFTSTARDKGYIGTGSPKGGYVLYQHDRIASDSRSTYQTVSYLSTPQTKYYYTCESDGTVRQFNRPNLATATEYLGSEESKSETVVLLDVDLYTKPAKGK